MNTLNLTSYLKLLTCEGIGVGNARKLLEHFKSVTDIFNPDETFDFIENPNTRERLQASVRSFDQKIIEKELRFIEQNNIKCIGILDDDYPQLLKECPDAPSLLFYKGDLSLLKRSALSVVGTRKITAYGKEMTQKLISEVKQFQPVIISGMAYGVDVYVYQETKKNDLPSVAVMGTSFKNYYPKSHQKHYEDLEQNGLIITEYAGFNKMSAELFIRRNRIVAGLSRATIVIESAEKGGSLSTAFFASDYSREVYAVPGKITDEFSKGCLKLIQQNRAQLLFDFNQIADDLNWNRLEKEVQAVPKPALNLELYSRTEQKILKCLEKQSLHIDDLALETALDMAVLNADLMMLELNGVVVGLQGKMFSLK